MTDSIGQQLRQAREARSFSLEDAAKATHIRVYYLKAFEAGEFEILPSLAQGKGFLRAYAAYLGLDPQPLLGELEKQIGSPASPSNMTGEATSVALAGLTMSASANHAADSQPDTRAAEAIFIEIGQKLRRQRELLGLSVEDVERHTHLRTHLLNALEAGELQGLPSPVQGRGMLHNYASFLGLDPEPLLLRFAEGLQALLAARQAVEKKSSTVRKPAKPIKDAAPGTGNPASNQVDPAASIYITPRRLSLRRFFSPDILLGAAVVILLAGFMLWGGLRILNLRSAKVHQTATATAPSIAEVLSTNSANTPVPSPSESTEIVSDTLSGPVETLPLPNALTSQVLTSTAQTAPASGELTPQAGSDANRSASTPTNSGLIELNLLIRQRAWMRVLVDGKIEFDGIALPGSAYPFSGDKGVEVLTGNGAAIQVVFNQTDLGVLGSFGDVVDRIYTLQGVVTPTASPIPTQSPGKQTPTVKPTRTPTATPTLKSTKTPRVTPTP
jgi:cytoskeletal protein RodZ